MKLLIVEDDRDLREGLIYAMKKEGWDALSAKTLEEAWELVDGVHLILLDVRLPDGSGYAFCKRLRERVNIPVLFLTACDEDAQIMKGFALGADDYITKPFRLGELIARIRAVMRRCGVELEQDAPSLTAAERKLLQYLRLNHGITLTRTQLLRHLWDVDGDFVDDNTLSVLISRLREKVDRGGKKHIVTVRGVGYRWND